MYNSESVDHVLLHCPMAHSIWAYVFRISNIYWVMPARVFDVLLCWERKFKDPLAKAIWNMVPSCVWWCFLTDLIIMY